MMAVLETSEANGYAADCFMAIQPLSQRQGAQPWIYNTLTMQECILLPMLVQTTNH